MSIEIRAARLDEVGALIPLYEWLFAPPGSKPSSWDPKRAAVALRTAIESHDCCVLVAEETAGATTAAAGAADEAPAAAAAAAASREGQGGAAGPRLAGFCTVYQDLHSVRYGYRAWIEDLAVAPDRRSQGIGAALLEAAKAWARERGATHLELDSGEARTDAHRFYERQRPSWRSISYAWEL